MFAKLNAALIATLIAVPAFAGQPNGRDSVYAGAEATKSQPAQARIVPLGRDSVYAIGVTPSKPTNVALSFRPGRA